MLKKLLVIPIMLIGLVAMNTVDLGAIETDQVQYEGLTSPSIDPPTEYDLHISSAKAFNTYSTLNDDYTITVIFTTESTVPSDYNLNVYDDEYILTETINIPELNGNENGTHEITISNLNTGSYAFEVHHQQVDDVSSYVQSGGPIIITTPPTITISNVHTTYDSITFDYAITDPDNTLTTATYTIGDNTYDFPDTSGTVSETNLDMDTTYTIDAVLTYDLNDGSGTQISETLETASTDPPDVSENLVSLIDLIPIIYAFAMIAGIGMYVKFGGQDHDFKTKVLEVFLMLVIGLALLPVIHLVIQNIYG